MNPIPQVLHRTATPVSVLEFLNALYATCPPRFPGARGLQARPVGLAISGGVDSMALAYLCARSQRETAHPKIADNLTGAFVCFIVDHKLREGSYKEALVVKKTLNALGLRAQIISTKWADTLAATGHTDQTELPNIETLARRLRYRRLASLCSIGNIGSLLLAHHQDDQYETVLMRLMSGHGRAGLLGMRSATDIPECHDMHGVYQSGFVDDQMAIRPMISYRPKKKDIRYMRRQMVAGMNRAAIARELHEGAALNEEDFDTYVPKTKWLLPAAPPKIEDGGIMIYRPLLEFSKDRLIATCEDAGVPWVEDATNADPTLTMRNAVRHLYKSYTLPVALQKPAILELSNRLKEQVARDEAEADRLLARTVVRDLELTAGTVVVQLPPFRMHRLRRGQDDKAKRAKRLEHNRRIAAILVKKLIAIVTPEVQGGFASNLQNTVLRLFPSLHDRSSDFPANPKPFNVSSVHFLPIRDSKNPREPLKWHLTREPYVSGRSPPQCNFIRSKFRGYWLRRPDQWPWPQSPSWKLWDGRFWVSIRNRSPVHAAVAPFQLQHAKAFRDALPDGQARDELMALLKLHAPGKVRWTLPAIYTAGDPLAAIADYERVAEVEKVELMEDAEAEAKEQDANQIQYRQAYSTALRSENESSGTKRPRESTETDRASLGHGKRLVALPTLGIAIPGLSDWIRWEVRYKKVDRRILEKSAGDEKRLRSSHKAKQKIILTGARRWADRLSLRRKRPVGRSKVELRAGKRPSR